MIWDSCSTDSLVRLKEINLAINYHSIPISTFPRNCWANPFCSDPKQLRVVLDVDFKISNFSHRFDPLEVQVVVHRIWRESLVASSSFCSTELVKIEMWISQQHFEQFYTKKLQKICQRRVLIFNLLLCQFVTCLSQLPKRRTFTMNTYFLLCLQVCFNQLAILSRMRTNKNNKRIKVSFVKDLL